MSSVLEKGDFFAEAKKALNIVLELNPDYAPAHLSRGYNHILSAYRNGDETKTGLESIYKALVNGLHGIQLAQALLLHRTCTSHKWRRNTGT